MRFSHPQWLPAGVILCLCLVWMWRRHDARQHAALARFVSSHLRAQLTQSVSIGRRRAQRLLLLTSVALLFIALAGPLVGYRWELISRRGNEIVFAVDTSRSMSTPDVKPDRLTRAKLAIDDFTRELDGDAVGLVAFAGSAFLACPITLDYGAFHESLNAIDTSTIPRGGTNIASAIREAQAALRRRPGSDKILILVTDGEDLEGDALAAAQAAAHQDGLKIYTVGVGTPQGDLVPVSSDRLGGFVKDESGAFVRSRLDEPALKAIAAATGGIYAPLGTRGEGFEFLYQTALGPMLKHDLASRQQRVYTQRYQWPLAGSLGLLLSSLLVGTRRRSRVRARAQQSDIRSRPIDAAAVSWLIVLLALLLPPATVHASPASAEDAYKKGDYLSAAKQYADAAARDPKKPVLEFNAGAAAYKAAQYPQAVKAFQQSISRVPSGDSGRLAEQEDAYYNLGNTLYRSGQTTEQSAPQQTLETWTEAVKAYDTALQMRADDADSKFNRDFVKRKIDELRRKQNSPQNQKSPQNQPQNSPQNQQKQPNQQQSPQNSGQPPNSGAPPKAGQPPPPAEPSPPQQPQAQPPPQQPPPQQQAQQPPPAQQPPNDQQQPAQPPGTGQPKPGDDQPKSAHGEGAGQADTQHLPGRMTPEEARQLLDSQKGDEHRAQGLPFARQEAESPPDKPVKDW